MLGRIFTPLNLALLISLICFWCVLTFQKAARLPPRPATVRTPVEAARIKFGNEKLPWAEVPQKYEIQLEDLKELPCDHEQRMPRLQPKFREESRKERVLRHHRLGAVRGNFSHAWEGYKKHAWLEDEVRPVTGTPYSPFGGWATTMIESLSSLYIMGFHEDFHTIVKSLEEIDFSTYRLDELNIFGVGSKFLAALISAYDLVEEKNDSGMRYPILLQKAVEIADMLYKAFDTPNRMPVTRWDSKAGHKGKLQVASTNVLTSEIASLTLEFTRLSQITKDIKYYDAVQRVMDVFEEQQGNTKLPGLWPLAINARDHDFAGHGGFSLGNSAGVVYENLIKEHILLEGQNEQYQKMYKNSLEVMKRKIFYRPMTKSGKNLRLPGKILCDGFTHFDNLVTEPQAQHTACSVGGMVAMGSKIFDKEGDMDLAKKLVDGCLWASEVMPLGIMPEMMHTIRCGTENECPWDGNKWQRLMEGDSTQKILRNNKAPPGIVKVDDAQYLLKPEVIQSLFILYRTTGDPAIPDRAWTLFESIIKLTQTRVAHSGISDVSIPDTHKLTRVDRMDSEWLGATLKYFYLIFAEPDRVSLDDFVYSGRGHPILRPDASKKKF